MTPGVISILSPGMVSNQGVELDMEAHFPGDAVVVDILAYTSANNRLWTSGRRQWPHQEVQQEGRPRPRGRNEYDGPGQRRLRKRVGGVVHDRCLVTGDPAHA